MPPTPVHAAKMACPYDPANPLRCVQVDHLARLAAQLRRIEVGTRLEVEIRKPKTKRSLSQNRFLWGVAYPILAAHLGYDHHEHEQLHYDCLGTRFGWRRSPVTGREHPRRTSSSLSTGEMSDYMEWLSRWAMTEHGVDLPLPDER